MKHRLVFAARPAAVFALVLALGALAGCSLKQAAPVKATYLVEATRPAPDRTGGTAILRVRSLQVAEPFDERGFVYRTGELSYETDFYHEFLVPPRALLTTQVRHWLDRSGKFRAVIDPASKADAVLSLEGNVVALYGDYRDASAPKAVLEAQFLMLKELTPAPQIVFQKAYRQAMPLEGRGPEALTRAWSKALEQMLTALESDLPNGTP